MTFHNHALAPSTHLQNQGEFVVIANLRGLNRNIISFLHFLQSLSIVLFLTETSSSHQTPPTFYSVNVGFIAGLPKAAVYAFIYQSVATSSLPNFDCCDLEFLLMWQKLRLSS